MKAILSILVCTLPEREAQRKSLFDFFIRQGISLNIEILVDERTREVPTGTKRNDLIARATGEYFCFVDDDDKLNESYVTSILSAIAQAPDVVTFQGWMTTNGQHRVDWTIKLGESYEERNGHYYRWPNHLCVFKKSLVQHIKFPDVWHGEDYKWSVAVRESGVLKTEVHIPEQLYWYDFKDKK